MTNLIKHIFKDRSEIYNKIFIIFGLYFLALAITLFLAGGDGIFYGSAILIVIFAVPFMTILSKFIAYTTAHIMYSDLDTKKKQINQITISDNSIVFKNTSKGVIKIESKADEFKLDELKIHADIFVFIHEYIRTSFNYTLPQAIITLSIIQNDGSIYKIEDNCDDIEHSLKLLKFLKQLDCFTYELSADTLEHQSESIQLENAIGNYLEDDVYDKKVFKYYFRKIGQIIGVTGLLILFSMFAVILTVLSLESVHLIP